MRTIELTCNIDIEQSWESFHAHAIPDVADIRPGDIIIVHDVPAEIGFGEHYAGQRRATLIRAGLWRRFWTRMSGMFALTELYEVGFQSVGLKG